MVYRALCSSRRTWWIVGGLAAWVLAGVLLPQHASQARSGDAVHPIIVPGVKYMGNASCAGSGCHGDAQATEQSGQWIGNESNEWAQSDPHAHGFETLKAAASKAMATKLGIADAAASSKCITCHAMDVPAPQRGELFALEDAVGCESCHGPGEKYLNPHADAGWTTAKRKELGSAGLFKQFTLVDTNDLAMRATTCVACHLQIDKDMIDAGHPPLEFELYAYNYYVSKQGKQFAIHWNEPTGKLQDARLWAVGQAAALLAADQQLKDWKAKGWDTTSAQSLRDLYDAAVAVAKKHFGSDTPMGLRDASYTPAKTAAAAADLAALAEKAGDTIQRRIVAYGVTALGSATFDGKGAQPPDEFWAAYSVATTGEGGEAYVAAVKQMAALAK